MTISGFRFIRPALAMSMLVIANPALASPLCTHLPRYGWVSAEEVEARLMRAGYKLLRLRITNEACYLALVANSEGKRLELRLHPASSEILEIAANSVNAARR
ncbi:MAG: PepSY domain-containing protein [Rhabdaerophilum sp.]